LSGGAETTRGADFNAVEFELTARQKPAEGDKYTEIARDTLRVIIGHKITAFMVNFGLEIELLNADSSTAEYSAHLTTIGSEPYNRAGKYRVEYGLPARMDNIPGKNNSQYQALISPRKTFFADTSLCAADPADEKDFKYDPSANFDFHFVKNSLADYHWNNIRDFIETDHRRFCESLDLTMPGKINFYLCPCPSPSVNWDDRFGYMVDPGRLNIYSIYNHDYSSVDPILPNMLKLYRIWGYAPPFLVEGLAGYFDFVTFEIKKLKAEGKIPRIHSLLTTSGYYAAEPRAAEITAAAFVKFLADEYGIGKVKALYQKTDDLSIQMDIERIFGNPIDSLERLWLKYIDTVGFSRRMIDYFASRAGALFDFQKQIEYYEKMITFDSSRADSIDTWSKLSQLYYQNGDYFKARDAYAILSKIDSSRALYHQILANLHIIDGKYDRAWKELDTVAMRDSSYATSYLLKAKISAIRGDTAEAIRLAEEFYPAEKNPAGKIDFLLFLGQIHGRRGTYYNRVAAEQYFSDALAWSGELLAKATDDPQHKLRAGLACLGLKEYGKAEQYLKIAEFTEKRPFFMGEILMALGNLNDLRGDRDKGIEFYQRCLAYPLAERQRELCLKYIDAPFKD
jgi:tetratricopeptide (TPR) repeat protein